MCPAQIDEWNLTILQEMAFDVSTSAMQLKKTLLSANPADDKPEVNCAY